MTTLWQQVLGGVCVVLGVAWVLLPQRMARLQTRLLYLGRVDRDTVGDTSGERLAGRIAGVVLAALGGALAVGALP
ncbi:MAG: hypothetical protein ABEJ89_07360 [Haloarculaceae archaeon]